MADLIIGGAGAIAQIDPLAGDRRVDHHRRKRLAARNQRKWNWYIAVVVERCVAYYALGVQIQWGDRRDNIAIRARCCRLAYNNWPAEIELTQQHSKWQ